MYVSSPLQRKLPWKQMDHFQNNLWQRKKDPSLVLTFALRHRRNEIIHGNLAISCFNNKINALTIPELPTKVRRDTTAFAWSDLSSACVNPLRHWMVMSSSSEMICTWLASMCLAKSPKCTSWGKTPRHVPLSGKPTGLD